MIAVVVLLSFAGAAAAPLLYRLLGLRAGVVLAGLPLAQFAWFCQYMPLGWQEGTEYTTLRLNWVPAFDVALLLRIDGLAGTFALLVTGIGAAVLLYASGYLAHEPRVGRFYGFILAFMGAMLGLVLSDDLLSLFIFWELTSVFSYLLIGFYHEKQESRDAALKALLVTGTGGLALLAGLLLLRHVAIEQGLPAPEAWRISAMLAVDIAAHPLSVPAFLLILLGAYTKSAQMPFHFWLPAAMAGPTPVSAFLHSATMVKAGVFLLARMHPIFGGTDLWHIALIVPGAITMLYGAIAALTQYDLKRILAYTTISALGSLVMLLGVGTDLAIKAMTVKLTAHAFYKAALFMVAGNVDHATGTRDIRLLGGLARLMPVTAAVAVISALSKAGAPPMFGFIGKELVYKSKLDLETLGIWLIVLAFLANVAMVAAAGLVAAWPFFRRRTAAAEHAHEEGWTMILAPSALVALSLLVSVVPGTFDAALGSAMATAIAGAPLEMTLKLWHGVSVDALTVLAVSVLTLAAGVGLYLRMKVRLTATVALARRLEGHGMTTLYRLVLQGIFQSAAWLTGRVQTGRLCRYVAVVLLFATAAVLGPLLAGPGLAFSPADLRLRAAEVILAGVILAGAAATLFLRRFVHAILSVGVSGLGVALFFVTHGAPDLAITQVMVETLALVLLAGLLRHLPAVPKPVGTARRLRDAGIAAVAGTTLALILLVSSGIELPTPISDYFARAAYPEARGKNVVNVILVDFRALDTLGEITVIALAAVGVYALLKLRPDGSGETSQPHGRA